MAGSRVVSVRLDEGVVARVDALAAAAGVGRGPWVAARVLEALGGVPGTGGSGGGLVGRVSRPVPLVVSPRAPCSLCGGPHGAHRAGCVFAG